jgi:hypothetical protein
MAGDTRQVGAVDDASTEPMARQVARKFQRSGCSSPLMTLAVCEWVLFSLPKEILGSGAVLGFFWMLFFLQF